MDLLAALEGALSLTVVLGLIGALGALVLTQILAFLAARTDRAATGPARAPAPAPASVAAIGCMSEAFLALDRTWRVRDRNENAQRLFAGDGEEARFVEAIRPRLEPAMRDGVAVELEEAIPGLGDRWFEVHVQPAPEGLHVCARDISRRRRAEAARESLFQELDTQRRRLEAIVDQMPAGIVIADAPSGRIARANAEAERILRIPTHSLIGVFAPPEWPLARALEGKVIEDEEREVERSDGTLAILSMRATPIRDRDGRIVAAVVAFVDVTDRKSAERERTRLLAHAEAARKEAEAANRAKDLFVATLSHELRTPLTAILGWLYLLKTGRLNDAQRTRGMETIERNARVQAQLIEDLLDVSRIMTGKLHIEHQPVDLAGVVEAATEGARPSAQQRGVKLDVKIDRTADPVIGDPARLQQVLSNLLANALKFTPEGGRVEVALESLDDRARLTVRDTGKGIEPALLPHIFDRFRQGDSTSTRMEGGLGLGLAIVRELVELHGGIVSADSKGEGQGATFTVELPSAGLHELPGHGVEQARRAAAAAAPSDGCDGCRLEGLRVLVVEDDASTREVVSTVLTQCGAKVTAVESVAEAFKSLGRDARPDVLVSDIAMPGENGYDFIRKLRARERSPEDHIPAAALTAYASEEDRQRALDAGFNEFLSKPIDPDKLARVVSNLAGAA